MNAYELADELENKDRLWSIEEQLMIDVCHMLRQQADRIAELEKLLEHSVGSDCREMRYIQEIENKDARIAELEKQTKPLSNDEILEIFNQIWNDGGNTNGVMHRFARAIEEKHGIK